MPIYNYLCDTCGLEHSEEEERGSPIERPCIDEKCKGTMERVVKQTKEVVMATYTPDTATQMHKENRAANEIMTRIRMKAGKKPIEDIDHMAAERHAGKKNGLVPGSSGEKT
jgi:predicted transcriptional regulator